MVGLAGCAADVGCDTESNFDMPTGVPAAVNNTSYTPDPYADCAAYAEDNGIYLTDVQMWDEGERSCYHTVEGVVVNANDETVSPTLDIRFYDDDGQVQMYIEKEFLELGAGETADLYHEQQMPCFNSYKLAGYNLEAEL